jgi:hypothetical protein
MSRLFYDNLLDFDRVKKEINSITDSIEEKEELWGLVDEIIHHRLLTCVLDNLDSNFHVEFIEYYHTKPHDSGINIFLKKYIGKDFESLLIRELDNIKKELLSNLGIKD